MIVTTILAASLAANIEAPTEFDYIHPLAQGVDQTHKVPASNEPQFERPLLLQLFPVELPETETISSQKGTQ